MIKDEIFKVKIFFSPLIYDDSKKDRFHPCAFPCPL